VIDLSRFPEGTGVAFKAAIVCRAGVPARIVATYGTTIWNYMAPNDVSKGVVNAV